MLAREQVDSFTNICSAVFGLSCDATLQNTNASFLGLPWAGWGVLYFTVIIAFLGLKSFLQKDFEQEANAANLAWTGVGSVVSLGLLAAFLSDNTPFCSLCMVVHIANLGLFGLFASEYSGTPNAFFQSLGKGVSYLFTGQSSQPRLAKFKLLSFGLVLLLTLVGYQRIQMEQNINPLFFSKEPSTKNLVTDFLNQKQVGIPVTQADATLGNENAPIQLVVFSDFECGYCSMFAEETKNWAKDNPDKIRIIFKHYPLSSQCNPSMQDDMHPNACAAAVVAQAAHNQGQFWAMHDKLFENNLEGVDFLQWATDLNLNVEQFAADYNNPQTGQKVSDDVALANKLSITGTPSVFLNGRAVKDVQPQNIQLLIYELLEKGV